MSRNNRHTFKNGIAKSSRATWSGDRITPNPEQQLTSFYVGQVMDDHDPLKMGRVWVYIPNVSVRRFDNEALPTGSTPLDNGDFDQELRKGWMLISPVSPFFGSDDFRTEAAPDGRNSQTGAVNAYGTFHQPRVGDYVAIMFAGGDPNSGYWLGMVPKPYSNTMVPGMPGAEIGGVSQDQGRTQVLEGTDSGASVPVLATVPTPDDPGRQNVVIASDAAQNMIEAGLSGDPVRGAGSSGSGRESPSYVTGTKSAGFSFASERAHTNTMSGQKFGDDVNRYHQVNTSGHSLVMDDHPDSQTMRLRTSNGMQLTLNDTSGVIYLGNSSNSAWVEISESGDISIFAEGNINIRCQGDYNLSVDGNYNADIKGNRVEGVSGDSSAKVGGNGMMSYGAGHALSAGDGIDINAGDHMKIAAGNGYHVRTGAEASITSDGDMNLTSTGSFALNSAAAVGVKAAAEMTMQAEGAVGVKTAAAIAIQAGGDIGTKAGGAAVISSGGAASIRAGGSVDLDGSAVNLQGGGAGTAPDAPAAPDGDIAQAAAMPVMPTPNLVPASPTAAQSAGNRPATEFVPSFASVVPTRQPWPMRTGFFETGGTNGYVESCPADTLSGERVIRPYGRNNKSCNMLDIFQNIRSNAASIDALLPFPLVGTLNSGITEMFKGLPFKTSKFTEVPQYEAFRVPNVFETIQAADLTVSFEGVKSIAMLNGFYRKPTLDPMGKGYIVGFGHRLSEGSRFTSAHFESENFKAYFSNSNDLKKLMTVTRMEALDILSRELNEAQDWMISQFSNVFMTQMQFDAILSFVHNIGPIRLSADVLGKGFIDAIKNSAFGDAINLMMQFSYLGGILDCSLVQRRRYEAARMSQTPDHGGVNSSVAGDYPVNKDSGAPEPTAKVGNFNIRADVIQAICAAEASAPELPKGYLFAICAQESGFRPNAIPKDSNGRLLSSAAGLFQFIKETGAAYGLSKSREPTSDVFDPMKNAMAGAKFSDDNRKYLVKNGITPASTELYFAHFMGPAGAKAFLQARSTNPGGSAAASFPTQANANKHVFYVKGDLSQPRTFQQVYDLFSRKIEGVRAQYTSICDSPPSPTPTPSGSVRWTRGLSNPNFTGVNPSLVALIERAAMQAGISEIPFNSGYRSQAQQNAIKSKNSGAASQSQHTLGRAIDVGTHSMSTGQIRSFIDALCQLGAVGIGIYGAQGQRFIHVDIRESGKASWGDGRGTYAAILRRYGFMR